MFRFCLPLFLSCAGPLSGSVTANVSSRHGKRGTDAVEVYLRGGFTDERAADPVLDCGMRQLFAEKAQAALPWRQDNHDILDALELSKRCNGSEADDYQEGENIMHASTSSTKRKLTQKMKISVANHQQEQEEDPSLTVYVCPKEGKDDPSHGNSTHPFLTLHHALNVTRASPSNDPKTIVLKPGIHFLQKPIVLTSKDSNLTIKSSSTNATSRAWLSGGTLLEFYSAKWFPMITHPHIWVAHNLSSLPHNITGLFTLHPHTRLTLARYPNADVEDWNANARYDTLHPETDQWIFPPNVGVPDFSSYMDLTDPNNPTGHSKDDSSMENYNRYGTGRGGACATVWGDLPSYWCGNVSDGGWASVDQAAAKRGQLNLPIGIQMRKGDTSAFQQRVEGWKHDPAGAIFHVFHSQGWAVHMFNISRIETNDVENHLTTIHFHKGGWQGGRNWECIDVNGHLDDCNGPGKKLYGGPWYVEGVLDELDAPGEFYWDAVAKQLYLYPRCSNDGDQIGPCLPSDLIATNLKNLIQIEGTQQDPARNVQLLGIGFRDAAKTYMTEQWSAPSGGDWALHRGGAVHLEGTENVTIADCQFQRLDGNAIMVGGYNRHLNVARSEFAWLGDGAMATWGDTEGYNATGGAQPRFSTIENNVMSNLGLYEKQSSAWGQNKACQNTIRNNVMFNLPRAAINFNDGLGGGNLVEGNVIFNTCRESGDHGPINSWDRMPFLADTTGSPSFTPLPTEVQHNIIMANYGAAEGIDNDDGSSWYYIHDNVFYQADGFKMDYGGHDSKFTHNLVYSMGGKKCYGTGDFLKGHADVLANNTCIVVGNPNTDAPTLGHMYQCELFGMVPTSNRFYTLTGNGTFACGGDDALTLQAMQQKGYELGSSLEVIPPAETVLAWARDILASQSSASAKVSI